MSVLTEALERIRNHHLEHNPKFVGWVEERSPRLCAGGTTQHNLENPTK